MENFLEAFSLDKLPPGTGIAVTLADNDIALFNVDGTIHAIDNSCPHAGGSLGAGKLEGNIVTCRSHGMKIDVTTGCFNGTTSFGVTSHPVKVVDGKIYVALESDRVNP